MKVNRMMVLLLFVCATLSAQDDSLWHSEHLLLGNPSNAQKNIFQPMNYLMTKKQYVLSYHRFYGTANWVAWHLDSTWLGSITRKNNFRPDSALPVNWYRVHAGSYKKSGFDRGHLCPSGDRTRSDEDNSITFLMTNMVPQTPNNNQGPWAALEGYCRDLVAQGKEQYLYAGGIGEQGLLDNGRVRIPKATWKVILVLDAGNNDLDRIDSTTRTIAVIIPNEKDKVQRGSDWRMFRVSIDEVEKQTGFDFLGAVDPSVQSVIEAVVDNQ